MTNPNPIQPRAQHMWVDGVQPWGDPGGRVPGVLLGWRQDDDGAWFGHVIAVTVTVSGPVMTQRWIEAEKISPAET